MLGQQRKQQDGKGQQSPQNAGAQKDIDVGKIGKWGESKQSCTSVGLDFDHMTMGEDTATTITLEIGCKSPHSAPQ